MKITVTCRSKDLEPTVKDYAAERVGRVLRVFDRLDAAHVVVDQERDDYVVEATVTAPKGASFVAHARNRDLRASIDATCQKIETQVRNWKERLVNHRPSSSSPGPGPKGEQP